ncbi:MAG: PAS domain S-box protein [Candidatus Bathyarchaeota archaeon]
MKGDSALKDPVDRLAELLREYSRDGSEDVLYRASLLGRELHGLMTPPDRVLGFFLEALRRVSQVSAEFEGLLLEVMITYSSSFLEAEAALRESEERYRSLVENSPNAISVMVEGRIVYANKRRAELAGKDDPSELVGTSVISQIVEGDRESIVEREEARERGEKPPSPFEYRMLRADGSVRDIVCYSSAISYQGKNAVQHVLLDVTEEKRYEERLETLHRHALGLALMETFEGIGEVTMKAVEDVLGYNIGSFGVVEGEFLRYIYLKGTGRGETFKMPLDGPGVTVRALRLGESQLVHDTRVEENYVIGLTEGEYPSLSELAVPVHLEGKPVAVINVESTEVGAFTVMDQRLLEVFAEHVASAYGRLQHHALLIEAEERYREVVDNSNDGILAISLDGVVTFSNRRMLEMTGYGPGEVVGRSFSDLIKVDARQRMVELLQSATKREVTGLSEFELTRGDGSTLYVEASAAAIMRGGALAGVQVICRDIGERKAGERRVRVLAYQLNGLKPGGCFISDSHERCFKAFADLTMHGVPGLCLAREDPEALVSRYGIGRESIVLVSTRPVAGFEVVRDLQEVSRLIAAFLAKNGEPVVVLDGLEYLVSRFGFDPVYGFIQEKRFDFLDAGAVLLVPVDSATLSDRERALIASEVATLM